MSSAHDLVIFILFLSMATWYCSSILRTICMIVNIVCSHKNDDFDDFNDKSGARNFNTSNSLWHHILPFTIRISTPIFSPRQLVLLDIPSEYFCRFISSIHLYSCNIRYDLVSDDIILFFKSLILRAIWMMDYTHLLQQRLSSHGTFLWHQNGSLMVRILILAILNEICISLTCHRYP